MIPSLIVFLRLRAARRGCGAVSLILQRHPIHSALSLIVVMVALAGLYLLLGAEFVAAVQIIVYGGAIMVLFVFVIMLLNAGEEERTNFSQDRCLLPAVSSGGCLSAGLASLGSAIDAFAHCLSARIPRRSFLPNRCPCCFSRILSFRLSDFNS